MSVAKKLAATCDTDKLYYTVTDRGDDFHVRIYANGKGGTGLTGLWQLLTDDELVAIGQQFGIKQLTAHRFQPGGIIVAKKGRMTCYALAVGVVRYLGLDVNADVRFI
jgi:hypothetical protein